MSVPELAGICNYLAISDTIGTAGQPAPDQFALIRAAGYRVVINLAMPTSTNALPDEAELVAAQGMVYVHIPVVWEAPTLDDLDRFLAAMERFEGEKVFVHCALNMRVSCFMLLYRVIRHGVPLQEAAQLQRQIWEPDEVWQRFMDRALARHGLRGGAAGEAACNST